MAGGLKSGRLVEEVRSCFATRTVALASNSDANGYPARRRFVLSRLYPELGSRIVPGKEANLTYELFRRLARNLGMDSERYATPAWNPLGDIIRPGQRVVIKPNLVYHEHPEGGDYQAVVTHGSLVRCVLDYVALALEGRGEITVGDAPLQSANFDRIAERTALRGGLRRRRADTGKCPFASSISASGPLRQARETEFSAAAFARGTISVIAR